MWICFEGGDRVGKTTQSRLLKKYLNDCILIGVPDRSGPSGVIIHQYLTEKCHMDPHALHLLFTVNRWEIMNQIREAQMKGQWVITDRWSGSGITYSMARGLDYDWCEEVEKTLPQPDLTIWLDMNPEELTKREGWGEEREETLEKQIAVREAYQKYFSNKKKVLKIQVENKSIDEVHQEIISLILPS